jgi:hypothetical protein
MRYIEIFDIFNLAADFKLYHCNYLILNGFTAFMKPRRSGNAFLPDIHMRQNVGQRKDVARPTRLSYSVLPMLH